MAWEGGMDISCWVHSWGESSEKKQSLLKGMLVEQGVKIEPFRWDAPGQLGACLFGVITLELRDFVYSVSGEGRRCVIGIAASENCPASSGDWDLLRAGVSDVLVWSDAERIARQVKARFERWLAIERLMSEPAVTDLVVAKSPAWRKVLRDIAEIARFSDATVLILGETGTGKEVVARLIDLLDSRPDKRDLVVLDCSAVVPELSGSEFFGHERGAFTGALTERDGAFALANGGSLFLDEIGELPLTLQAQLLRVVQERTYKRVGGNSWRRTVFRLICATNRDLLDLVRRGTFRADLYYRIAGCICKVPPLRERLEDIIPLAEHFLREAHPDKEPPEFDDCVRDYLLRREYPGNVRDLQQLVSRLVYRQASDRTISIGCIPPDERPVFEDNAAWLDCHFERPIQRAVLLGAGLKEISRAAEDVAIRYATEKENGNLQRAACCLGVTDRALQLRRANGRHMVKAQQANLCARDGINQLSPTNFGGPKL
jgi:transcriptional regulator with GAF, ATPase, and Fis domain